MAVHELQAVFHALLLERAEQVEDLRHEQPNLLFSPAESRQRPAPSLASLTRTPSFGRTSYFFACFRISASSEKFSTTGMIVRPSFAARMTASM